MKYLLGSQWQWLFWLNHVIPSDVTDWPTLGDAAHTRREEWRILMYFLISMCWANIFGWHLFFNLYIVCCFGLDWIIAPRDIHSLSPQNVNSTLQEVYLGIIVHREKEKVITTEIKMSANSAFFWQWQWQWKFWQSQPVRWKRGFA